jgi:hypothetical protein
LGPREATALIWAGERASSKRYRAPIWPQKRWPGVARAASAFVPMRADLSGSVIGGYLKIAFCFSTPSTYSFSSLCTPRQPS